MSASDNLENDYAKDALETLCGMSWKTIKLPGLNYEQIITPNGAYQ